jgi:DNA-directed RNA polymerase sigma subunit (sigma70/sigma32)
MPRTARTSHRLGRQAALAPYSSHTRLAHYLANRRRSQAAALRVSTDDLHQEALAALWRAAQRFDPARGCKFITLAHLVIPQGLERFPNVAARERAVCLGDLDGVLPAPRDDGTG